MGNYLRMLIALLSLKRKLRSRLGSSLVSQSCNPVSYTHLDVYKRQFMFPVPFRKTKHADGRLQRAGIYRLSPFEPPRTPWPGMYELLFLVPNAGPVSYTHLDVYKRQLHSRSLTMRLAFTRK